MTKPNYQEMYDKANFSDFSDESILKFYNQYNEYYNYFLADDTAASSEFIRFFHFFYKVKDQEDIDVSNEELYFRAYKACVLFGGVESKKACKTLQLLINESYSDSKNPVHDVLTTVTLPNKAPDLNLTLWRKWINGSNTKSALMLFASASDIANKFGPIDGYVIKIAPEKVSVKNIRHGEIYLQKGRNDPSQIGLIFRKDDGELGYIILDSNDLCFYDMIAAIEAKNPLTLDEERLFFNVIQKQFPYLRREVRFEELHILQGKLLYQRFEEAPELALLCYKYNQPEHIFENCLSLSANPKTEDKLPDIIIDGNDYGHKGYYFLKLPINDPHVFLLGQITNCCQSIGGHAEQCVIDGWTLPNNGFYVLLKSKKMSSAEPMTPTGVNYQDYDIVGQGYAWRSLMSNLVFDSWENLRPLVDDDIAVKLLMAFSQKVVTNPDYFILRVMIGHGGKTPQALTEKKSSIVESMAEGAQYGDSIVQSELFSRNIDEWKGVVAESFTNEFELSEAEKEILIQQAPLTIGYLDLIQEHLHHPWIKRVLRSSSSQEQANVFRVLAVMHATFYDDFIEKVTLFVEKCYASRLGSSFIFPENLLHIVVSYFNNTYASDNVILAQKNLSEAGLLTEPGAQANINALMGHQNPIDVAHALIFLNKVGLLTGAEAQANRNALMEHQKPVFIVTALKILNSSGLLTGEDVLLNRKAIMTHQNPTGMALGLKKLSEAGLLTGAEAKANRDSLMGHPYPDQVAGKLFALSQVNLLSGADGQFYRNQAMLDPDFDLPEIVMSDTSHKTVVSEFKSELSKIYGENDELSGSLKNTR